MVESLEHVGEQWEEYNALWYLQIDCAAAEHRGSYLCSVSNVIEERWTEPADVDVGKSAVKQLIKAQ